MSGWAPAAGGGEEPVTVALDGRGTDAGPAPVMEGAIAAAGDGIAIRVFGDPAELGGLEDIAGIEVVPAPSMIGNEEEPVAAVRSRPDASVVMAAADVAEERSAALVSAGSTGATMAASLFALRRMRGVRRPALALQLAVPGREGPPTVLLDGGANSEARPGDLVQFGFLGSAFSEAVLGVREPRVALLSVGEEAKKGRGEVVEAHEMLRAAAGGGSLRFVGNVEGRDLLTGRADVVVSDGFTGNVALKTLEGTARAVGQAVADVARSGPVPALGGLLMRGGLQRLRRRMDPDSTGGAMLLGIDGIAVVGHGSSGPEGIANAVRLAARCARERAVPRTAELLQRAGATRGGLRGDT